MLQEKKLKCTFALQTDTEKWAREWGGGLITSRVGHIVWNGVGREREGGDRHPLRFT